MDPVYVNIEHLVTLQCRAVGVPKPSVIWLKNRKPIKELFGLVILPDDSLLFQSAFFNFYFKLIFRCGC